MANFTISADLLKLQGAAIQDLRAADGSVKRCVVIPIWDAGLYEGKKGVYLDMTAIELSSPRYEDTHLVKQSLTYERYKQMTEQERENIPILGGLRSAKSAKKGPEDLI